MHIPRAATTLAAAAAGSIPLHSLTIRTTPNGFTSAARGWNSFGIQANGATDPDFVFNQANVTEQCDVLASPLVGQTSLVGLGYTYCSLDSGWSQGASGDDNGRIIADSTRFNILDLANHLHGKGVYSVSDSCNSDRYSRYS